MASEELWIKEGREAGDRGYSSGSDIKYHHRQVG